MNNTNWFAVATSMAVFVLPASTIADELTDANLERETQLRETVTRYFSTDNSFREGDLIVRSQVSELQSYLRRTRGTIDAANPRLLKRVVNDNSILSRFYYRLGGAEVMREAAQKLGGYRQLEALCASREGKIALQEAIKNQDSGVLMAAVEAAQQSIPGDAKGDHVESPEQPPSFLDSRIYTVDDFLTAAFGEARQATIPGS